MIYVPQCQKYTSIFDRYCQIVNKESDAELQVSHQLSFGFQLRFGLHVGLCVGLKVLLCRWDRIWLGKWVGIIE